MITTRRGLIGMFAAGVAAAIVRPGVLMPVKVPLTLTLDDFSRRVADPMVQAHAERLARTLFYGDDTFEPMEFSGFATLRTNLPASSWRSLNKYIIEDAA